MNLSDLPAFHASCNAISFVLLIFGIVFIKRGDETNHKRAMVAALISTLCFLTSYLIYHYFVGSVPYPYQDWTRTLYFTILIPHVILAAVVFPCIIIGVTFAIRGKFDRHAKLMRKVWPVWMFVSVTGVIIYVMLYQL